MISFVKNVGSYNSGTAAGAAVWTIPVGAGGVAQGNSVIVFGGGSAPTLNSVTDSRGNVYTVRRSGGAIAIWLAEAKITTALQAGDVITVTRSATGNLWMMAVEFVNLGDFVGVNAASQASTTAVNSGAVTAGVGDLVLGALKATTTTGNAGVPQIEIATPGSGFTNQVGINFPGAAGDVAGHTLDWQTKIAAAAGSETSTATLAKSAAAIYGLTAVYKESTSVANPLVMVV